MTNIFTAPTKEVTEQQAADSLPRGRAWGSKNIDGSNTRGLINSVAVVHNLTQQKIEELEQQFRIEQTTELLEEWETSVGLPDNCTAGSIFTLEQRRNAVTERLQKKPIVTLAEMQAYADSALPDVTTILYTGETYDTTIDPGVITALGDDPKFVIVVQVQLTTDSFVYEFSPMEFLGGINASVLTCILNKVIPANVLLLIYYT